MRFKSLPRTPASPDRPLRTRLRILTAILAFGGALTTASVAQDETLVGQRVMVVRTRAQFRARGQEAKPAPLGMILEVAQVSGTWLWSHGQPGWIEQDAVVLLDRAVEHFTAEIDRQPGSQAYHHRGIARAALGNFERAVADFTEAIRQDAKNVAAYNDRGNARRKLGRLDEAVSDFSAAIERGVRHPAVYTNRGVARHEQGKYDEALADFNAALQLNPRFAPAWDAGGAAREAQGDDSKAIANYRRAIEFDPNFDRALNNLAWLLATHPDDQIRDAEAAVRHAAKANELTNNSDAGYLDTLAAALAAAGRFDDAVQRAKEALTKADTADQKDAIQRRLELFEAAQPFRKSRE